MKKSLLIALLAIATTFARADQTVFQPTIFSTGSSLTLQSGVTTTFASGSVTDFASGSSVDFAGASVTGLSYEPALGNPATSGWVLSSTTGGVRSWIALSGGGAPTGATYITQTSDGTLSAEVALSSLSTGLLKSTTISGALTTITDSSANWDTAFSERRQWDGGNTNLVAANGRINLGATTLGANLFTATNNALGATGFIEVSSANVVTLANAATHRANIGAGTGSGTVTNIATTSPVQGGAITNTGTISLNLATDFAFTTPQSITLTNTSTSTSDSVLTLSHNTSSTATTGFGTTIWSRLENAGGSLVDGGQIQNNWTNAAAGSETSSWVFLLRNAGGGLGTKATITGAGAVDASDFTVGGASVRLPSGGAAGAALIKNSATSYDASWIPEPFSAENASIAAQTGFASNTYITGSAITVPAGSFAVGGQYLCRFDMTKTAAGVAAFAINVHVGTLGTTGDAIVYTFTSPAAQTAAIDNGWFEVMVNFRSIGASAFIVTAVRITRTTTTAAGFLASALQMLPAAGVQSSTFNSTAATKIGLGFNGGTSFSGTVQVVQTTFTQ